MFESSGVAVPDIRHPNRTIPRWNLFWHTSREINRSARVEYLGNLHAEWTDESYSEQVNIEFCFLSAKGKEIHEAMKNGFVAVKMRA